MTAAFPDPRAGTTPAPTPTKSRPLRRLGVWVRNALVVVGLICLIGVAALWVAAAHLNDYRADVESAVSDMLGHPITIGAVEASWEGLAPVLRLRDVALHGAGAGSAGPPIRLDSAEIALDPVASARTRTLRSRHIRVVGAALTLTRNPQGKIAIAGFGQHAGTQGRSLPGATSAGWQAIAFAQRNLELLRTQIRWLDLTPRSDAGGPSQGTVAPVTLGEINARIRNTADRHHLRAWISPGEKDGRSLVVRADVTGSLAIPGWSAKLAIDAEGLDLGTASRLARHFKPGGAELVAEIQGTADLALVLKLRPEGLQRLDGTMSVLRPGIRFERPDTADTLGSSQYLTLERIDLDGVLSRDAMGWLAKTRQLKLVSRDGIWPTERASVRVVSEQDQARRFEISADRVRIEHVRTLLDAVLTRPALKRGLETASPTGEFRDFTVTAALLDGVIRMRGVEGEVVGLDTRGDQMIPGVKGVHGRVEATAEGGRFTLSRGPREFTLPSFYRGARKVTSATGTVEWTLGTEGGAAWSDDLVIRSEGVEATLNGAGLWRTDTASPFVTTTVTLNEGTVGAVSRLLLIKKLPGAFHTWFKGAVKGGTVKRLSIATQGYVHALPFDAGPSGITLSADIRGVEFAYAPGWPQASDVSARIRVRGRRFDARVISAKLFGARSKRFAMVIPNLTARPLRLDINGTVSGDAADALRFVRESVLDSSLGHQLSELAATGPCEIALNMALEVPVGRPKRLAGTVKLNENRVSTGIGPVLENASGTLEFDLDGLRLRKATALYLDTPVMLSTQPALDDGATVIEMQGSADRAFLKRLSAAPDPIALEKYSLLDRIVKGRSKWQASLQLPSRKRNAPRVLRVTTPLTGMALDLPGALGKLASETRPLEIALVFGQGNSRELKIRYGSDWNGAFSLAREDETWAVERGHLRLS